MDEKLPKDMTLEELLELRDAHAEIKDEAEAVLKICSEEFLIRLKAEKISGKVIGNRSISKATRISFSTTLEAAKALGAVKEAVDNDVLKKLYLTKKIDIPGVKISEYIIVRDVEKVTQVLEGGEK